MPFEAKPEHDHPLLLLYFSFLVRLRVAANSYGTIPQRVCLMLLEPPMLHIIEEAARTANVPRERFLPPSASAHMVDGVSAFHQQLHPRRELDEAKYR
jgi:hypothetical protein